MSVIAIGTEAEVVEAVRWCCEDSCNRAKTNRCKVSYLNYKLSFISLNVLRDKATLEALVAGANELWHFRTWVGIQETR